MNIRIAMAGLAHGHGIGFIKEALKYEGVSVAGFFDDTNRAAAEAASAQFGAPVFDDLDELLCRAGANTFLTAEINSKKAPLIIRAVEAGLNVAADKPMVTTVEDLKAVQAAISAHPGSKLYLMLTERFNPLVETARRIARSGAIGRVVTQVHMRPHRLRPEGRPDWMMKNSKTYGGILNDIGVHDIDIARMMTGAEVDAVLGAYTSNLRFTSYTDFCDHGEALLRMSDGSTATVIESWMTPDAYPHHGESKFIIHGTNGQIEVDTLAGCVKMYSDTEAPHVAETVKIETNSMYDVLSYFSDPSYTPVLTTADAISVQLAALYAQAAADAAKKL